MELWEIKANALKLMFADTDLNFNRLEFENGAVYNNGNTREKLVRMNDSIKRAIDLYYQYCGQSIKKAKVKYKKIDEVIQTELDLSEVIDFGLPSRIDIVESYSKMNNKNLEFYFDYFAKKVFVEFPTCYNRGYKNLDDVEFILYYSIAKYNLPKDDEVDELTFDLNDLDIPEEIQRVIPLYVKGELYEEDEYAIARQSKMEYLNFLSTFSRKISQMQTRVKSNFIRG